MSSMHKQIAADVLELLQPCRIPIHPRGQPCGAVIILSYMAVSPFAPQLNVTLLELQVEPLVLRGAFSNVVLWSTLMADAQLAGEVRWGGCVGGYDCAVLCALQGQVHVACMCAGCIGRCGA